MDGRMYMWADYPFPLISTPAVEEGVRSASSSNSSSSICSGGLTDRQQYTDQFVKSASKMALVHNIIIRGMNAMYLQCEYVTARTARDFLTFCECWSEMLHNHHQCEEAAYFPIIERAVGEEGLAESNTDEHEAFMPGLRRFDEYVRRSDPHTFSGRHLYEILDSFAAALQVHLTDEVVRIQALRRFGRRLDLGAIDALHGAYVRAHSSRLRLLPYLLTNHDLTYEGGIHAWWPSHSWLRDVFLRYACTLWHRGAWRYSSCTVSGHPRHLLGIRWDREREARVKAIVVEMDEQHCAAATAVTAPAPALPPRAHVAVGHHTPVDSQDDISGDKCRSTSQLVL